jgi:hypothetical protein
MGPAYGGVEFLEGALPGIKKFMISWMKKSQHGGSTSTLNTSVEI